MKYQLLATILTVPAIATAATTSFAQSDTTTANISCNLQASTPTVMATVSKNNHSQEVTMLSFLPQYFSPEAATENCQTTAKTLQTLYQSGRMNYLASDTLNGKPTICAVETRGVVCDTNSPQTQILFSFQPGVDPTEALYNMLGSEFKQSSPKPDSRTVSRIYSDFKPRNWFPWPFNQD